MTPLWLGLLKVVALLAIGTVSWAISLFLHEKHMLKPLGNLLLALFMLSFMVAIMLIISMWYGGEDWLYGKVSCFRLGG